MKTLLAAIALAATASLAAADPVEGLWQTEVDDGHFARIRIAPCGAKICGTIEQAYSADGTAVASDSTGKQLVWDMEPRGGGAYGGGRIWQPSTGKVYRSKMKLDADRLTVSGCVGPICKSQIWHRR